MTQAQQGGTGTALPEWQNLATKADVAAVQANVAGLQGDVAGLQGDVAELRDSVTELRTRMEFMATKEDLAELRAEFAGLHSSLRTAGWFAGLVVGLLAVLVQIGLFFLQRSLG